VATDASLMVRADRAATVAACVALMLALSTAGCSRQDSRLEQHTKNFASLGATVTMVTEAWLAGQLSGTYTRTALEKTFQLVEQERTALAQTPQALQDRRGARLSQVAEQLSRLIATLLLDVRGADGDAARRHVSDMPIRPAEQR
jgi:hypothetical protein